MPGAAGEEQAKATILFESAVNADVCLLYRSGVYLSLFAMYSDRLYRQFGVARLIFSSLRLSCLAKLSVRVNYIGKFQKSRFCYIYTYKSKFIA
jgi:hypothetical protein